MRNIIFEKICNKAILSKWRSKMKTSQAETLIFDIQLVLSYWMSVDYFKTQGKNAYAGSLTAI